MQASHMITDRLALVEAIGAAAVIEAQVEGAMSKASHSWNSEERLLT